MPYLIVRLADGYIRSWERNAPDEPCDATTEARIEVDGECPDQDRTRWDFVAKSYRRALKAEMPLSDEELRAKAAELLDAAGTLDQIKALLKDPAFVRDLMR